MADLCHTLNEMKKCQSNALKPNETKKLKKSVKQFTNILKNAKNYQILPKIVQKFPKVAENGR